MIFLLNIFVFTAIVTAIRRLGLNGFRQPGFWFALFLYIGALLPIDNGQGYGLLLTAIVFVISCSIIFWGAGEGNCPLFAASSGLALMHVWALQNSWEIAPIVGLVATCAIICCYGGLLLADLIIIIFFRVLSALLTLFVPTRAPSARLPERISTPIIIPRIT